MVVDCWQATGKSSLLADDQYKKMVW
jgi:hypothetical protein